ncbi:MAG: family 10 glycosylhydrolase [Candidatus Omnitrophica bacterium]|nr:family 10 glycosylhydrolase [Candidatus Omnitrophota bacterium]
MYKKLLLTLILCTFLLTPSYAQENPRLGVWITVFSPEEVLASRSNVDKLIETCKKCGINDVYIQVYRADKAYYDSDITDKTPYENIVRTKSGDTLKYLIEKAASGNISIHAWINVLSLAQNKEANIIRKYGDEIITIDQHSRTSLHAGEKDDLDKYYIRENQLFLEPGDWRVRKYIYDISKEIVRKYPGLSGLHLDYIRYPAAVPFVPGARFPSHGISYGYTGVNLENFKNATGLNAKEMPYARENFKLWDDWRRKQLTTLLGGISKEVRSISPNIKISCTIVASVERTYLVTFQDWTKWLANGLIDYVVAMDYTDDTRLFMMNAESLLFSEFKDEVQIGVGAYLLNENPDVLKDQIGSLDRINPAGIVIFSYDDIAGSEEIQEYLSKL